MRRLALVLSLAALLGCAETVRCPDGEVFDESGACAPIPDAGPDDAGPDPEPADAGPADQDAG